MRHEIVFSPADGRSRAQRDAGVSGKRGDAADARRKATLRAAGARPVGGVAPPRRWPGIAFGDAPGHEPSPAV
jgi:hypothetical protein